MSLVQGIISVAVFTAGLAVLSFLPDVRNFDPAAANAIATIFGAWYAFTSIFEFMGHFMAAVITAMILEASYWGFLGMMWALRLFGKA